jgi:hypothetical protein
MPHEPAPWQDAQAQPFPLAPTPIPKPDDVLADLQRRLELTRWTVDAGNQDWSYGVHRGYLQQLVEYCRGGYDWRTPRPRSTPTSTTVPRSRACRCTSCAGPGSARTGPADLHPRLALDVLALGQGHRPFADPGAQGGDPAETFEVIVPSFPASGARPRCPTTRT